MTENDFDVFNQMIDVSSFQKGKHFFNSPMGTSHYKPHPFIGGSISPPGSYDQIIPPRSATSGLPPHLPSLLQQTVLNQDLPSEVIKETFLQTVLKKFLFKYLRPHYLLCYAVVFVIVCVSSLCYLLLK